MDRLAHEADFRIGSLDVQLHEADYAHVGDLEAKVIETPGHTAGHMALLVDERFLFTGDHLDFDRQEQRLFASYNYCWYSWPQQIESIEKLTQFDFEWALPGHGQRVRLSGDEMKRQLRELAQRMRARSG